VEGDEAFGCVGYVERVKVGRFGDAVRVFEIPGERGAAAAV